MTDEDNELIRVGFESYKRYFMNYNGGWSFIIASQLSMCFMLAAKLVSDYYIGQWASDLDQKNTLKKYSILVFALAFIQSFAVFVRSGAT